MRLLALIPWLLVVPSFLSCSLLNQPRVNCASNPSERSCADGILAWCDGANAQSKVCADEQKFCGAVNGQAECVACDATCETGLKERCKGRSGAFFCLDKTVLWDCDSSSVKTCEEGKTCATSADPGLPDTCNTVCVPNCDGRFCGSDGCGGSCGTCPTTGAWTCNKFSRCVKCSETCAGKQCGLDACGGNCPNLCAAGTTCNPASGQCY